MTTDAMHAGKRALVTGGDRGIGAGIAGRLASQGASVCLVARDRDALTEEKAKIEADGADCAVVEADLATIDGAQAAIAAALDIAPRWDFLVNNAGIPGGPPLLEMDVDLFDRTFAVHVRAAFMLAQALVPGMIEAGGGKIVNISSTASLITLRNHGAYSPAKAALNMLTSAMAVEWGAHNIQANAICPTVVLTKLGEEVWGQHPRAAEWMRAKIPAQRFGEVSDVVAVADFLLSPAADFVNGVAIPCDGGQTTGIADGPPADD